MISNALSAGFNATQVLEHLLRTYPRLTNKVQKALRTGFTADQVLSYLSGGGKELASSSYTAHQKTRRQDVLNEQKAAKSLRNAGVTAAALAAAPLAAIRGAQALPRSLSALTPDTTPFSPAQISSPAPGLHPSTTVPNQIPSLQPTEKLPNSSPAPDVIKKTPTIPRESLQDFRSFFPDKILPQMQRIAREQSVEAASDFGEWWLKNTDPKAFDRLTKKYGKNLPGFLKEHLLSQEPSSEEPPSIERSTEEETESEEDKSLKPQDVVLLPDGKVGTLKRAKNGIADIDVDGTTRSRKEKDLIKSPISQQDLAQLFDELLGGIESYTGKDVSRHVMMAGYDPENNELVYIPQGGEIFVFSDISPEDASKLTNILQKRKTTGNNFIGAWEQGTSSPIGAEMSKLIQKLRKEGKKYFRKYNTLYHALEPAYEARKQEEKRRNER